MLILSSFFWVGGGGGYFKTLLQVTSDLPEEEENYIEKMYNKYDLEKRLIQ